MAPNLRSSARSFEQPGSRAHPSALGPYWLYERLGVGGLACVFRARRIGDPDGGDVALKRLHPHLARDKVAVASFVKEARISYLLDHPVIRRVHALGREYDEMYIIMEYVDGKSLFNVLRRASKLRRRLPVPGVLSVIHRLCDALDYAHNLIDETGTPAGFVHRDVSPSNLIVTPGGRLKLIDLGVARAQSHHLATNSGLIKGKYGYMAPEVLARRAFDRRADVYSVGVVMWELLTLHKLYPVADPPVNIERVRARPVDRPSVRNPACPPELDAIIMRALARDPSERWPSCAAMADAIHGIAVELDEPLCEDAIAELPRAVEVSAGIPTLSSGKVRARLARGTTPDPLATPLPTLMSAKPAKQKAPAKQRTKKRTKRRRWPALLAAAIAGVMAAGATIVGLGYTDPPALGGRFPVPAPPAQQRPLAMSVSPLPQAVDAGVPVDAIPIPQIDAGLPEVSGSEMSRLRGPRPGSRTSAYRYRARLCTDKRGQVRKVELIDGPRRLEKRIAYALRRWRYAPYRKSGYPQAVCFVIESMVRKLD